MSSMPSTCIPPFPFREGGWGVRKMAEHWITVAQYNFSASAHMARLRLAREGIPCLLLDERMSRLATHTLIGVRLQVRESDIERAHRLLHGRRSGVVLHCAQCGSERLRAQGPRWMPWIFALALLSFVPRGRRIVKSHCLDCGHVGDARRETRAISRGDQRRRSGPSE